jgi:hypothetical protein
VIERTELVIGEICLTVCIVLRMIERGRIMARGRGWFGEGTVSFWGCV